MKKRTGILAAGNWIVDHIKVVDVYPNEQSLANIKYEYKNNGGAPFNVLKNLSRLGAKFPLKGAGLIGEDNYGQWIKDECIKNNIDISCLQSIANIRTSYTDVISVESTGRRTFFHQRGANYFLDVRHIDVENSNEKIFHLGYLLLLDKLDKPDSRGNTGAAKVLKSARESGLITSVDIVSEDSNRFKETIFPSLPFIDFLFLNEFEAERSTGINLSGSIPGLNSLKSAARILLENGVNKWVLIHFSNGVFAAGKDGQQIIQGAVKIPDKMIAGSVGAGDAFAAGVLYGIHQDWEMKEAVRLGVCTAASSLQDVSCSDGIKNVKDCLELGNTYSFYELFKNEDKIIVGG